MIESGASLVDVSLSIAGLEGLATLLRIEEGASLRRISQPVTVVVVRPDSETTSLRLIVPAGQDIDFAQQPLCPERNIPFLKSDLMIDSKESFRSICADRYPGTK